GLTDAAYKSWNSIHEQGKIPAGIKVEKGTPIFPRLDMEADVEKIKNMMTGPDKSSETEVDEAAEEKPEVVLDDIMTLDLRVGEIVTADKMKNDDKILQLQVDIDNHKRQIISRNAK